MDRNKPRLLSHFDVLTANGSVCATHEANPPYSSRGSFVQPLDVASLKCVAAFKNTSEPALVIVSSQLSSWPI